MLIYKIVNTINNKIYIGQTSNLKLRLKEHKRAKSQHSYLHSAIRKYGWDKFAVSIVCEGDKTIIDELERKYIAEYKSLCPNGYNLETGGNLNKNASAETRRKQSEANIKRKSIPPSRKGCKLTEEHKAKVSAALKGRKPSDNTLAAITKWMKEHKEEISNKHKGKKMSEESRRKLSLSRKGFKMSEEQKEKLRSRHIGSKHTQEHKDKISAGLKGHVVSKETRQKLSATHKARHQQKLEAQKKEL